MEHQLKTYVGLLVGTLPDLQGQYLFCNKCKKFEIGLEYDKGALAHFFEVCEAL